MAGFGLPNFGQLTEAFKKAKQIQQDAQKLQDELENMEIEGKSDDEMIKVWISGNQLPLKVEVQENILDCDKETIEQNILQAIKKAHELSTTTMKERMNELGFMYTYTPTYSPWFNGVEEVISIGKSMVKNKRLDMILKGEN